MGSKALTQEWPSERAVLNSYPVDHDPKKQVPEATRALATAAVERVKKGCVRIALAFLMNRLNPRSQPAFDKASKQRNPCQRQTAMSGLPLACFQDILKTMLVEHGLLPAFQ
jgi:hypothetical protein